MSCGDKNQTALQDSVSWEATEVEQHWMRGNAALGKRNPPQPWERMKAQVSSGFPLSILFLSEEYTDSFAW